MRYADDCNVYVHSHKAGEQVMAFLRRLYARLHLTVNETKSAVASVIGRKFLGDSLWVAKGREVKLRVADKPLQTFKQRIRQLTRRSGGITAPCCSTWCCRLPTLTGWVCPDSHDLNFSNRPVRTRMPGGVAGAQSIMAAPYANSKMML